LLAFVLCRELLQLADLFGVAHLLVPQLVDLPLEVDEFALVVDLDAVAVLALPFEQLVEILGALALVLHLTVDVRVRVRQRLVQLLLYLGHLRLQELLRRDAREVLLLQVLVLLQYLLAVHLLFLQLLLELLDLLLQLILVSLQLFMVDAQVLVFLQVDLSHSGGTQPRRCSKLLCLVEILEVLERGGENIRDFGWRAASGLEDLVRLNLVLVPRVHRRIRLLEGKVLLFGLALVKRMLV
jgi:hypothetical protein